MARTKGAVSHVGIKLSELNAKFSQDAVIPVSRRFLEMNSITSGQALVANRESMVAMGEQPIVTEVTE